jgi:hypothetical protein
MFRQCCYANHAYKLLISHFQGVFFFGVELVAKHVHARGAALSDLSDRFRFSPVATFA